MNSKEALVIIIPGFPANEDDTTCLPTQQVFVKELNRIFPQLNVIIITIQYPHFRSEYLWHQNHVFSIYARNGKRYKLFNWIRVWNILNKIRKDYTITGLLSIWCTEFSALAKYYGKLHNLKYFCWIQGQDAKKGNKFIKLINPKPNELIAISDFLIEEFDKNYRVKPAHRIPNGIDETMYSNTPSVRDIDILGVGSLTPLKQYNIFIDVIKNINEQIPYTKCVLCGSGPEMEKLTQQIADLHLQDMVSIIGNIPDHKDVYKLMQRSKVFLHTSSYEGFGTVCLEALYAGAHVVSFHKPMNDPIKNWHVVNTKEEMAAKAVEILNNTQTTYEPVNFYNMPQTVDAIMKLFSH